MVRVITFVMMLVMLPVAAVAQKSITTGSVNPNDKTAVTITVTGAPGDGNASLRAAAGKELEARGVIDRPGPSAYNIRCTVSVVDARDANGKQPFHIEWVIRKPGGEKLGTVSQRNEIPAGSLDGAWGKAAENAAWAAVQRIMRLLVFRL